jgi:hypothetical protein
VPVFNDEPWPENEGQRLSQTQLTLADVQSRVMRSEPHSWMTGGNVNCRGLPCFFILHNREVATEPHFRFHPKWDFLDHRFKAKLIRCRFSIPP